MASPLPGLLRRAAAAVGSIAVVVGCGLATAPTASAEVETSFEYTYTIYRDGTVDMVIDSTSEHPYVVCEGLIDAFASGEKRGRGVPDAEANSCVYTLDGMSLSQLNSYTNGVRVEQDSSTGDFTFSLDVNDPRRYTNASMTVVFPGTVTEVTGGGTTTEGTGNSGDTVRWENVTDDISARSADHVVTPTPTVEPADAAGAPSDATTNEPSGSGMVLPIIGIAVGAVVVGAVLYYLLAVRPRRAAAVPAGVPASADGVPQQLLYVVPQPVQAGQPGQVVVPVVQAGQPFPPPPVGAQPGPAAPGESAEPAESNEPDQVEKADRPTDSPDSGADSGAAASEGRTEQH